MGVLDDMLDDAGVQGRPATTFGDVLARAVGTGRGVPRVEATAPSLDPLLALDDGMLRRLIRYLPADAMVPLLARANVPVAQRLVGLLDAESQAWLAAQSEAIEACTVEAHAAAARQALGLIARAQGAGPVAAPAPAAVPKSRPVEVGVTYSTPVVPVSETPVAPSKPVTTPPPVVESSDDVVETLAALIALAAGRSQAQLNELAEAVDHPVLAEGLKAVARGADGHEIDETARIAGGRWLDDQTRRVELMRQALLAIRFGDSPQRFRDSVTKA